MVKSKKMSKSSIAVIVLSILLVLSMIMGITGAWFTDKVDFNVPSETLGFGRVDINEGEGTAEIEYTIYEKTAQNEKDYLQLIDGDKITITDNLNVVNNSNVDILCYVKKTLDVEVKAGNTELDDITKANVLSWLKRLGGQFKLPLANIELNAETYGIILSGQTIPAVAFENSYNGEYVVDSEGAANALLLEGTFKITVTAHVYAVQKGNLEVFGENSELDQNATLSNVKAAFVAAGVPTAVAYAWTTDTLCSFGLVEPSLNPIVNP